MIKHINLKSRENKQKQVQQNEKTIEREIILEDSHIKRVYLCYLCSPDQQKGCLYLDIWALEKCSYSVKTQDCVVKRNELLSPNESII